ncbi:hypothetical protein BPTFM16_03012 [Altererythrobacter insulae]|nr:hypothetical protein BPTFM16_03012 [Altererythrobacter insulae]
MLTEKYLELHLVLKVLSQMSGITVLIINMVAFLKHKLMVVYLIL